MRACRFALLVGFCLGLSAIAPSWADNSAGRTSSDPVYFAGTKSYFQDVRIESLSYLSKLQGVALLTWESADTMAGKMSFKGAKGRLAVVKDLDTHEFLQRSFQVTTFTWIGLRYWCATKRLQYSDGSYWEPGQFYAWDVQWDQSAVSDPCAEWHSYGKPQFMVVAYSPLDSGFRWIAKEWHKAYDFMLVEFPTGHP